MFLFSKYAAKYIYHLRLTELLLNLNDCLGHVKGVPTTQYIYFSLNNGRSILLKIYCKIHV